MQTKLTDAFEHIRQQFEEHLSAINDNAFEVQALFDYLHEIDLKLDKVTQRLDQLQLMQHLPAAPATYSLTHMETKIFLALYTEEVPLAFKEIAAKTNLPYSLVPEYISSLVEKGIPMVRSFYNDKLFLQLDPHFKEMQAKQNVVNVSLASFLER